MESQTVDAVEFRGGQRQQWSKGAEGWRKRSDFIDAATAHVSKRMVELAGVERGSRVLDVAAGYGEPSLTAAAVTGAEGKVVATDTSPAMVAYGREGGGFSDVEVEETEVSFEWQSAGEFVAMVKDTVPPLVALIAKHAPDDPDRAWEAILGAVKETASDDGTVTFSNLVLLAAGRA